MLAITTIYHVVTLVATRHPELRLRTVALSHEQIQQLADILGVKAEDFFRAEEPAAKRGGPVGRAKRAFEVVSKLPRSQQQKILDVVEALVAKAS